MCHFGSNVPALDEFESLDLRVSGDLRIVAGNTVNLNFITASVGALFESFSLVFLAYTDRNGDSYIVGVSNYNVMRVRLHSLLFLSPFFQYDIGSTPNSGLTEDMAGFDRRLIADGPVRQLQLNVEAGLLYAVTDTSVSS